MSFTDKKLNEVYKDILHTDNSNTGISTTNKTIACGDGDTTALQLSNQRVAVYPAVDNTTILRVRDADGNSLLEVDSTNDIVKAGIGRHTVNTQYAKFAIGYTEASSFVDDTHQAIPYDSANYGLLGSSIPAFGTGTDPATTFTTAEGNATRASDLVPVMWLVPDNIAIDAVYSFEGADTATGDTTRMHLFSYTFNSGSTSALADGPLLAHNSDVTNAGSEQAYKSTWTVDSANVDSNKVILAFFRSDSINSDYSVNIKVKYHLR